MCYDSFCVQFGRCDNQISAGTMEMLWLTRTETAAHSTKNETQQRSVELKYNAQQKGKQKIILRVGGSCFEYSFVR